MTTSEEETPEPPPGPRWVLQLTIKNVDDPLYWEKSEAVEFESPFTEPQLQRLVEREFKKFIKKFSEPENRRGNF